MLYAWTFFLNCTRIESTILRWIFLICGDTTKIYNPNLEKKKKNYGPRGGAIHLSPTPLLITATVAVPGFFSRQKALESIVIGNQIVLPAYRLQVDGYEDDVNTTRSHLI